MSARRLGGQSPAGPTGVEAQSWALTRACISLGPEKEAGFTVNFRGPSARGHLGGLRRGGLGRSGARLGRLAGQPDMEGGAVTGLPQGLHPDAPAVLLDDALADGQP